MHNRNMTVHLRMEEQLPLRMLPVYGKAVSVGVKLLHCASLLFNRGGFCSVNVRSLSDTSHVHAICEGHKIRTIRESKGGLKLTPSFQFVSLAEGIRGVHLVIVPQYEHTLNLETHLCLAVACCAYFEGGACLFHITSESACTLSPELA